MISDKYFDNAALGPSPTPIMASPMLLGVLMYFAYFDDSGTNNKNRKFQVLSAVAIKDDSFQKIELLMPLSVEKQILEDSLKSFEEFHACDLFNGHGAFEKVGQEDRFKIIRFLLNIIRTFHIPVIWGAVDLLSLQAKNYASANPLDVTFRLCAKGINRWLQSNAKNEIALFIADDSDKATRATIKKSFRDMRTKIRPPSYDSGILTCVHDDMYFGDSKDSVGIQLADLCSYFISKHLEGDESAEGFYKIIEDQVVDFEIEPQS